jgi:hypothetical protein
MPTRSIPTSAALALLLGVTACAAPSQPWLDNMRRLCSTGSQAACDAVPVAQSKVDAEHAQQAREVAGGILLGLGALAVGAAAGYAASQPTYYTPVYVCHGWGC